MHHRHWLECRFLHVPPIPILLVQNRKIQMSAKKGSRVSKAQAKQNQREETARQQGDQSSTSTEADQEQESSQTRQERKKANQPAKKDQAWFKTSKEDRAREKRVRLAKKKGKKSGGGGNLSGR